MIDTIKEHADSYNNKRVGYHVILDLYNCQCCEDNYKELVRGIAFLNNLVEKAKLTPISYSSFQFEDSRSYTATVTLFESHIAIHTWSQHKFISMDIFTCSKIFPTNIVDTILTFFKPEEKEVINLNRGSRIFNTPMDVQGHYENFR